WKGLAVVLIWPSIQFWWRLLTDFHQALDIAHPFTWLTIPHLALGAVLLMIAAPVPSVRHIFHRRKPTKAYTKAVDALRQTLLPAVFWLKPFFQDVGSDRLGRVIAGLVGGGYLVFAYLTLISIAWPAAWTIETAGHTVEAHNVSFVVMNKSGTHPISY